MNSVTNHPFRTKISLGPNEPKKISFTGSYVAILSNTASVDPLISIDQGLTFPMEAGTGLPTVRLSEDGQTLVPAIFKSVTFINSSNSETMVIDIQMSLGPMTDTRSLISGFVQVDLSAPFCDTPAPIAVPDNAFRVLAANVLVKERIIQNNGNAPVWWGGEDIDPAAMRGTKLNPGGSAVINCWGVVYLKAEAGGTIVSVNNIQKVV